MLDDATVHIENAASCGYRYTTATRLEVRSTTHRCVEVGLVLQMKQSLCCRNTEEEEEGSEKEVEMPTQVRSPGRQRANIEGSASDGARGRGNCDLGTDCADFSADCARRSGGPDASGEVKRPS